MPEPVAPPRSIFDRRSFATYTATALATGLLTNEILAQTTRPQSGLPDLYPGLNGREFRAIQRHENEHVAFIVGALGAAARPKPTFKNLVMPNIVTFTTVSRAMEATGTGAYAGAGPAIFSKANLAAAGRIAQTEARHTGYLNFVLNRLMTINVFNQESAFERQLTLREVIDLASPFIANLNGGPPIFFSPTPSRANDIAILNTALVIEYLEQEFYNINVPRFFPA